MTDRASRRGRVGEGRPPLDPAGAARNRVVRVPDGLWLAAQAEAKRRGETVAAAVRRFLEHYARSEE